MQTLIGLGAVDVVVPGVLPIGCFPLYLTLYQSSNKDDYDDIGCLKSYNNLSSYHNELLRQAVSGLQSKHAGVRLMYADFYAQVADMVRSPETFGTHARRTLAMAGDMPFLSARWCIHVLIILRCAHACRAEIRAEGVLRRRRAGLLQLQQQCAVRNVRVERVRRPGQVPGVGRHPSHGSRLPLHRGWLAQGHLLQPRHPALN